MDELENKTISDDELDKVAGGTPIGPTSIRVPKIDFRKSRYLKEKQQSDYRDPEAVTDELDEEPGV